MEGQTSLRLSTLYPGYFAVVMATGILSVVSDYVEWLLLSKALFVVSIVLYVFLLVLYGMRIVGFSHAVRADMFDPLRVFGYFTFVAATDILATRLGLSKFVWLVIVLGVIAFIAWCGLLYFIFAMLLFENDKPVEHSVNGSWLITTVATQSLSIVCAIIATHLSILTEPLLFAAYVFWSFGILLYLIFIVLIVYRFFFRPVHREDLTPPYWINMGAMAITAVAGARLAQPGTTTHFLTAVHPFVVAFTVTMWAWGTWWIPLLVIMGLWKYHALKDFRTYDPSLWSIIFPLGMYATSLDLMSSIPGLHFLIHAVKSFVVIALGGWCLVSLAWAVSDLRKVKFF
ncbi:tellurite resistance/C4-dicarboxylate transporter family protein [Alicyclobacillus mengziensis]|uniref:Tellurite resistance/C4-dicarboxylate transporter family protein n=1 Tax=Alicyclobacillus mengziensis TaxID=2931921 RepID=A0A9X7VW31_9BACL|nr:tellurite resistance/C4-dicarboxylate transporter family protein [Alicyclobacillus mengziensis]QSO45582.1 tellurite resistance/C4-dicarboxylate transporter family protein [Alicyclobacillus mengziensis]